MSEFVFFKLPQQPEISYWRGTFSKKTQFTLQNNECFVLGEFNADSNLVVLEPALKQTVQPNETIDLTFETIQPHTNQTSEAEYVQMVETIQHEIKCSSNLNKVVLAKAKLVAQKLNVLQSFYSLCEAFPNSMVYLASSREYGTWLGASPEVFLSVQDKQFETFALAGTKTLEQNWTQKEIEEQNWVTQYIEKQLQQLEIAHTKTATETIQSGQLFHLKTSIKGSVQLVSDFSLIVQNLNPTPAVAGIDKNLAVALIQKLEKNKRSLYTGIVGPIFKNNQANLFVNLRCMQAFSNAYCLYAGAGITKDSDAKQEWLETEKKMANTQRAIILHPPLQ